MSRHVEILRQAKLDAGLFGFPAQTALDRKARPHVDGASAPRSPQDRDQWQQLVHALSVNRRLQSPYAIGLASATAGEGTTYAAFHLAAELARSSARPTLLLEANLHRPDLAERFGLEPGPGLAQLLRGEGYSLEDCIRETPMEQLALLAAGADENSAGNTIDWGGLRSLYATLRERFAAIVVDLPPVNLSPDFLIVGPLLDGLVLVVHADLCSREVIQNAVARLRRANLNLLGTILNKRKFFVPGPIYRRL